jgi:hypothetical protein
MLNRVPNCEDNCLRVFRDVMLCRLVDTRIYRNSRGNCYLIYQNKFIQFHNEGCNLQVLGEPQMAIAYSRLLRFPILAKVHRWYTNIRAGIFYLYYFMGTQRPSILHRKLRAPTAPSSHSHIFHFLLFLFLLTLSGYSLGSSRLEGFESILRPEIKLPEWRLGYFYDLL